MKTIIVLAALVLCLNNKLSAQNAEVNAPVSQNFQNKFSGATDVSWQKTKQLDIALFQYQGRTWIAYFDHQGDLVASARRIREIEQLPVTVQASLTDFQNQRSTKGGPFTLGPIFEVLEKSGKTYYYVPMENQRQTLSVSINHDGYASIQKKATRMSSMIENNDALLAKKN
ncbi:MAG TPA: hypothetical protein VFW11_13815 [Cyclobacteriaceae bacterium]|nr:hypothetical protein [Cyclobacteriaceae bacterium]